MLLKKIKPLLIMAEQRILELSIRMMKFLNYCNTKSNDLGIMDVSKRKITGQVYFTSEKIAENAIKDIGEDRIKKYLFEIN